MFLATAACMLVKGLVDPRSSETVVAPCVAAVSCLAVAPAMATAGLGSWGGACGAAGAGAATGAGGGSCCRGRRTCSRAGVLSGMAGKGGGPGGHASWQELCRV